jgi:hypothetical protein
VEHLISIDHDGGPFHLPTRRQCAKNSREDGSGFYQTCLMVHFIFTVISSTQSIG